MTAQETLIEINQGLQAIGASRTRKYYQEEIEWIVNKMQMRFVQDCLRRKGSEQSAYLRSEGDQNMFEIDEIYRDAIKDLLKEGYVPADYYNSSGLTAMVRLPVDYSYALDLGIVAQLCTQFRYNKLNTRTVRIMGIPNPPDSTATNGHFFENLQLNKDSEVIYSHNGYYNYNSAFQVLGELNGIYTTNGGAQIQVSTSGKIGEYSNPGYILLLVPDDGSNYSLTYESTITTPATLLRTITTKTADAIGPAIDGRPTGVVVNVPARSVNNTNTFNSGTTPYFKTSKEEVTTKINGQIMFIDTATNFIVNGIVLSYVRKPRRFSVSLNVGLDIAADFHPQICDMVVNHIRERIGDPKYQTGLIDSQKA